jgi:hypothetical protein
MWSDLPDRREPVTSVPLIGERLALRRRVVAS